jgi:heme/copper-type cytochrome/quinol oxidase subunit 1
MGDVSYKIYKEKLHILASFVFITDVPRYRAFSPVFIYSVCLYVVVNIMAFLSAKDNVLHLFEIGDNIRVSIFNALLTVMLVNCTGVPVLAWIDTPKFVQYLHKWEKFQVGSN